MRAGILPIGRTTGRLQKPCGPSLLHHPEDCGQVSDPGTGDAPGTTDGWAAATLVEVIAHGLAREAAARDAAQEILGVDSLPELALQPLVATALREAGYGVWPEQRYPRARRDARRNRGRRCDLVLTTAGRPLAQLEGPDGHARLPFPQAAAPGREDVSVVPLAEAFWLEIKNMAQHAAGTPAADYNAGLFAGWAADVRKMSSAPGLIYAGLLLIAFTADAGIARRDLDLWRLRCLAEDLPLLSPATAGFAINDRQGNAHCSLALFPILSPAA